MCAIIDANVSSEVFGRNQSEAGREFLRRVNSESLRLVIGGKLLRELAEVRSAREWLRQAIQSARIRVEEEDVVNSRAEELHKSRECRSDDPHIIALAQISGARLLYSNDRKLQDDFRDSLLIHSPRGKVYSTSRSPKLTRAHRNLLSDRNLCQRKAIVSKRPSR